MLEDSMLPLECSGNGPRGGERRGNWLDKLRVGRGRPRARPAAPMLSPASGGPRLLCTCVNA